MCAHMKIHMCTSTQRHTQTHTRVLPHAATLTQAPAQTSTHTTVQETPRPCAVGIVLFARTFSCPHGVPHLPPAPDSREDRPLWAVTVSSLCRNLPSNIWTAAELSRLRAKGLSTDAQNSAGHGGQTCRSPLFPKLDGVPYCGARNRGHLHTLSAQGVLATVPTGTPNHGVRVSRPQDPDVPLSSVGLVERPPLCAMGHPGSPPWVSVWNMSCGCRGLAAVGSLWGWRVPRPPQVSRVCSPPCLGQREGPGDPGGWGPQLALPHERSSENHTRGPCWEQPPPAQGFLPQEQEG